MTQAKDSIREFLRESLAAHRDDEPFDDAESLFLSGRLDSLAVTQLVVFLEENFQVDFGRDQFDVGLLDSVDLITQFVREHGAVAAE
jgi:acyl carrier protein